LFIVAAQAADWAVIVAGSNQYYNYRHQADACHAYQIVSKNGMAPERIVMMYYDDIANNPQNPYPGKLYNKPTQAGTPGVDVYAGCQKDYTGNDVTAANFLYVLTGNQGAVPPGKKVLKSTANDNVFVFFTDHGGTGIVAFPVGPYLTVADLNKSLRQMFAANMYRKLVFYMEACESGSMFENVLPTNLNIYVTTASNAVESSWGCYCPPEDVIDGRSLGSCLGDLYSVNWMEDADKQSPLGMKETLQEQFVVVKQLTTMSHVMQYGDLTWTNMSIGNFQGERSLMPGMARRPEGPSVGPSSSGVVESRDIKMHTLYYAYLRADRSDFTAYHFAAQQLQNEIEHRLAADDTFASLTRVMVKENWGSIFAMRSVTPVLSSDCVNTVNAAVYDFCGGYSDYSIQYSRVVNNLCVYHAHSSSATELMVGTLRQLCR